MHASEGVESLVGLPQADVYGPSAMIHRLAWDYMEKAGLPYVPIREFARVDIRRAKRIANAFERMAHDPSDPRVQRSYEALKAETLDQFGFIKRSGLVVQVVGHSSYPYEASPRLAVKDILDNKRLSILSTDGGFGSGTSVSLDHPMLEHCDEVVSGRRLRFNDVFRVVHDFFGHAKDGVGFRADGEENAWRSHAAMYSRSALGAMTSELRGQNSWANYGRYGDHNRKAREGTVYAPQKAGLLPAWCWDAGRLDDAVRHVPVEAARSIRKRHPAALAVGPRFPRCR